MTCLAYKGRNRRGVTLVELAASLVFGLPLLLAMLYATLEASYLFNIRTNLDHAARRAAAMEAYNYQINHATTDIVSGNSALDIPHFVSHLQSPSQFTVTFDTTVRPRTVTVTCTYPTYGNQTNGLFPFPSPDLLNIGSKFSISATTTFPLLPE